MKIPDPILSKIQGTILIFSLVIILGGTLVLAGWAQMLATRAAYTNTTIDGQKQRIAIANGRALARQYVLNQMPSGSIAQSNYSLADGWGGFAINYIGALWTNTNFIIGGNPFNPVAGDSFISTNIGTVSNGTEAISWTFRIRSRSPLLAGFPLFVQNPGTTNLGAWALAISNRVYWNQLVESPESPSIPITSGQTTSGLGTNAYIGYFASPMSPDYGASALTITFPTNTFSTNTAVFMPPAITNGTGTVTRYFNGGLVAGMISTTQTNSLLRYEMPNGTALPAFTHLVTNYYTTTGEVVTTNENVYITGTNYTYNKKGKITGTNYTYGTNSILTTNTTSITNSATNTYIDNYTNASVTQLTIQASANTNTLHLLVLPSTTNLSTITLSGTNNARKIFINHAGGDLTVQTATAGENYNWWLGLSVAGSDSPLTILAPTNTSSLTIQGGIRTDRNISINQGNVSFQSGTLPITTNNLPPAELATDRIMWLEEQRSP